MKWTRNEGSELPGLTERNVLSGEWSGYIDGRLEACIHMDDSNYHWFGFARADQKVVATGHSARIADAKLRCTNVGRMAKIQAVVDRRSARRV